jgi:RimJ/RimL family protein N-acetyltransferase
MMRLPFNSEVPVKAPDPIVTERLVLRLFTLKDTARIADLVGEREIADTTLSIPHPYEEDMAREWIATHAGALKKDEGVNLAVVLREPDQLIGAIGLRLETGHARAEMGYWIGKPYWGQGYGTEAARAVLAYGFDVLKLNRIYAHCLVRNPPSARILRKIGMSPEGRLRQHVRKWGTFEDIDQFGILREDYRAMRDRGAS